MYKSVRHMFRTAATGVAVAVLAIAGSLVATSAPAAAHTERQAINAACGSSYGVVSDGRRAVTTSSGSVYGYVVLTYSTSTGRNCLVTYKHNNSPYHGTRTRTVACLDLQGQGGTNCDGGNFYHWEDRERYAAGVCVRYTGYIYSAPDFSGTQASGGRSYFGNCGS